MGVLAILSGLGAALIWGASDFAGGLASRRATAAAVVLASGVVGGVLLALLGLLSGAQMPPWPMLLAGAAGGLAVGGGLLLFYHSMACGQMCVAAPLTAIASGGIPLLFGLISDGLPGPVSLFGFALALAAVVAIAWNGSTGRLPASGVVLPLLAGVGFGVFLTIIGRLGREGDFFWPLAASRFASVLLMAAATLWSRRGRASWGSAAFPWALVVLVGLGDTGGNVLYAYASQIGRLDVTAVLGALYPAATVLLARLVLGERLSRLQNVGVAMALTAVVLIAV